MKNLSNPVGASPRRRIPVRTLAVIGVMSAVSFVLQLFEFPLSFLIPDFVKMDLSDLPALLSSFALGPSSAVAVCLLKNLLHFVFAGSTGGAGELANFLLSASFTVTAGLIYKYRKTRARALLGAIAGAVVMALISFPLNYYVTYPVYSRFLPIDVILDMYRALVPSVAGLPEALLIFNLPFTLLKGLLVTLIAFLIYKPLRPILRKN